jgi:hypothetical protein
MFESTILVVYRFETRLVLRGELRGQHQGSVHPEVVAEPGEQFTDVDIEPAGDVRRIPPSQHEYARRHTPTF